MLMEGGCCEALDALFGGDPCECDDPQYRAVKVQPETSQAVSDAGHFEDGRWTVVLKRALTTDDPANDLQFEPGRLVPVAFHAWDGGNGEAGLRMSLSSWYLVLLEVKTPPRVYAYTAGGIFLMAGLEVWLVRRRRRQ